MISERTGTAVQASPHGVRVVDPELERIREVLLSRLLEFARRWSQGQPIDPDWEQVRHEAIRFNHRHYLARIPVYAGLAESAGLRPDADAADEDTDELLDLIVNELLVTDAVFKSYDPAWLQTGDFGRMTRWLGEIHATELSAPPEHGLAGVREWSSWLAGQGVHLSYSSGTSGRMSFVPRDARAFKALMENSRSYARTDWFMDPQTGRPRRFACLIAGPRGHGLGILGAAAGLARLAVRAHYHLDLDVGGQQLEQASQLDAERLNQVFGLSDQAQALAAARTVAFLDECTEQALPVLVFGPPFLLRRMCLGIREAGGCRPLRTGSMVSSGGGWKSFSNERISAAQLRAMVDEVLGLSGVGDASVAGDGFVDAYSTAELNCTLMSCAYGRYHVPPLVEPLVLDEDYLGAIGTTGRGLLGFLDPFATSYPGFFVTGDIAELGRGRCECGLDGYHISGEIQRARAHEVKGCGGVLASLLT